MSTALPIPTVPLAIEPLNEKNYFRWVASVKIFLRGSGLLKYVEDPNEPLTQGKEKRIFSQESREVFQLLTSRIELDVLVQLGEVETPFELWESLKKKFLNVTMEELLHELREFYYPDTSQKLELENIANEIRRPEILKLKYDNLGFEVSFYEFTGSILPFIQKIFLRKKEVYIRILDLNPREIKIQKIMDMLTSALRIESPSISSEHQRPKQNSPHLKSPCRICGKGSHNLHNCTSFLKLKIAELEKDNKPQISGYSSSPKQSQTIIIDTGASISVTGNRDILKNFIEQNSQTQLAGKDTFAHLEGYGSLEISINGKPITVPKVYFSSDFDQTYLSMFDLVEQGFNLHLNHRRNHFLEKDHEKFNVNIINGQFCIDLTDHLLEHKRLGHPCHKKQKKTVENSADCNNVEPLKVECLSCDVVKTTFKQLKPRSEKLSSKPLELIHSDIKGPINIDSVTENSKYIITFIDDFSRYAFISILSNRAQALEAFKSFQSIVEPLLKSKVQSIMSDNAKEYRSREFRDYLTACQIQHLFSAPETPEQNGIAERFNRTLQENVQVLLRDAKLKSYMWPYAAEFATHVYNRRAHSSNGDLSPYQLFYGKAPSLKHLKPFGCLVVSQRLEQNKDKDCFAPANSLGILVGFPLNMPHSYSVYQLDTRRVVETRKAKFYENLNIGDTNLIPKESVSGICNLTEWTTKPPLTVKAAFNSDCWNDWKAAMDKEMASMHENDVFELVPKPASTNIVKPKWVFTWKDSLKTKFKARLVARGFTQVEGIDYKETFSPTLHYDTLRVILALSASENWSIIQMDVSTAFLNANLEENIFMSQPEGFEDIQHPNYVWKLKKAIYGLKQAPRQWNSLISSFIISLGFKRLVSDTSIFVSQTHESRTVICLYVDDLLILGPDPARIEEVKALLNKRFKMNELNGEDFLGFRVTRDNERGTTSIDQNQYVEELLSETNFTYTPMSDTPMDPGTRLPSSDAELAENFTKPYQSLVGALSYLAHCSRPDLSFAVHQLSMHMQKPGIVHWKALERVLSYLKRHPKLSITYSKPVDKKMHIYSDSDWGGGTTMTTTPRPDMRAS